MKAFKTLILSAAFIAAVPFSAGALAQVVEGATERAMQMATGATPMSDGEVRKIDKDSNKITLRHGEIKNLEMPGMTMVFRVKDAAMLDKVEVGAKVRFAAEKIDGAFVITAIQSTK